MTLTDPILKRLDRLVGSWTTVGHHPLMPGVTLEGAATFEWLDGERFLIQRMRTDHPDIPNAICIIGDTSDDRVDEKTGAPAHARNESHLSMHYYDSRGVFRLFGASIDDNEWKFWRDARGFSMRFTGKISADGNTIVGQTELRRDDVHWEKDLEITYRRAG